MLFERDDLVHLLAVYESVVAARPIGPGNAEFLDVLLSASRALAECAAGGGPPAQDAELALVARQHAGNARELALRVLRATGSPRARRASRSLYVPAPLAALPHPYRSATVIFGPGLGMGDEISFRLFLKRLAERMAPHTVTVFDLYPGLWSELLPGVRALHYRGHPLRPFDGVAARDGGPGGRDLVVVIDFDGYYLHERLGLRAPHRDVLEIALGLHRAWFARGGSRWVRVADVRDAPVANNYWLVRYLTAALLGGAEPPAWEAVRNGRPHRAVPGHAAVVLLNPFSSKDVPVTAERWVALFAAIRNLLGGGMRVVVFPGTSASTHAEADALCAALAHRGIDACALTTPEQRRITPFNAIRSLVAQLRSTDYCVTIDSFPAHIVPLFGVPTVVVTLKDNREFWVPSAHALYVPAERMLEQGAAMLAKLRASAERVPGAADAAARRIAAATENAFAAPTPAAFEEISRSLFDYVGGSPDPEPVRRELLRWFRFFSAFGEAFAADPLPSEDAASFVRRWSASEAYKYVALEAVR